MNKINFEVRGVIEFIERNSNEKDFWILSEIETLTDLNSFKLGDLWFRTRESAVEIYAIDICCALREASQIITLDLVLKKNTSIFILIEDGEII